MKISLISPAELDDKERSRWRALQLSNPALVSPYFCVEFTRAVAQVRSDVRVAVLEEGANVVGYFPHQGRFGAGQPVGGSLSDHHGVIMGPNQSVSWPQLLRACGLSWWQFDHLVAAQSPGAEVTPASSPALDLGGGFLAYRNTRIAAGCRRIAELDRKARKLAREVGPLRFEAHVDDRAVFSSVLRRKSEQCLRTRVRDVFAPSWTRHLVDEIRCSESASFAGRLSALYAGDALVAAHLGMRSDRAWHWWFPVYDHDFAKHSPGALLLLHVAQAAAAVDGVEMLDLGKGDDVYKESFANCSFPLVEGCVQRPSVLSAAREVEQRTKRWLRTSTTLEALRPLVRALRRANA